MNKSLSTFLGIDLTVDDKSALRLSPEGTPALPLISGPRLAVVGRIAPRVRCSDCRDFEAVMTRNGVATCPSPAHSETNPQLPMRPTPHERDGRQPTQEPIRPRSRASVALLAR
ncbi:hypothetical protein OOK58_59130 [Streptomyces sp. NBC_01728]|uniref:hypothetical protein n=1 Tax=unclassified Streptomyces TaxID=2593676 RepID=UPI002256EDA4|nr:MULTISPECIES: hypothetical protein [unclassified Streptomyces]MCX4462424.1 hypothetical protein [Streptomyces sp. NBC_01719]MCX4500854.1 hypothetical protein [Streptomyces sp. NBC_01728]